jgi:hypothetical protein
MLEKSSLKTFYKVKSEVVAKAARQFMLSADSLSQQMPDDFNLSF